MNISENKLIKIAIIGPECSGKTSLANALANSFDNSLYIPEFARIYANNHKRDLTFDDIWPIALGQIDLEKKHLDQYLNQDLGNFLNNKNNIYIFHDTTLINTRMYAKLLYNKKFNKLDALSREKNYDFYFLLDYKDIIWQPEKFQRGYSDQRKLQDQELRHILQEDRVDYFNISGDLGSRMEIISNIISDIISDITPNK